jgi:hypothetical protein
MGAPGPALPSGTCIAQMIAGERTHSIMMVLLK